MPPRRSEHETDEEILDAFEAFCKQHGVNGTIVFLRKEAAHGRRGKMRPAYRSVVVSDKCDAGSVIVTCYMRLEIHAASLGLWSEALQLESIGVS